MANNADDSTGAYADLSHLVLLDVLSKLSWEACHHLRPLSESLRAAVDAHVLGHFQLCANMCSKCPVHRDQGYALLVVRIVAEPFISAGFASNFVSCLLEYHKRNAMRLCDPFKLGGVDLVPFVQKFFESMPVVCEQSTQKARLLLNVALMRLLGSFDDQEVLVSSSKPLQWRLALELHGPYLGWLNKKRYLMPQKHAGLVLVLAKLLYLNLTQNVQKEMWQGNKEIFIYGHDQPGGFVPMPVTLFSFEVHGPKNICVLLRSCFENGPNKLVWAEIFPANKFKMSMEVYCPRAKHHGCKETMLVAAAFIPRNRVWAYRREQPARDLRTISEQSLNIPESELGFEENEDA